MRRHQKNLRLALVACACFWVAGCDSRPTRLPIEGRILVDGKPLGFGSITFVPEGVGPKAVATVRDGQYQIESQRGPLAGSMVVEVRAPQLPTDKPLPESTEKLIYDTVNSAETLPPRYNRNSELRASVTADGPNQFDFELKSK